jgi:hypothetical protein
MLHNHERYYEAAGGGLSRNCTLLLVLYVRVNAKRVVEASYCTCG